MASGRRATNGRSGETFSYREWATSGFRFGEPDAPYTKTGGRTRSDYDLAIEALVSTSERGRFPDAAVLPEHRSICGLCLDTRSVAEVAAHLRLPLGVARVLIGDMAGLGLVLIHQSGMGVGDPPA